MTGIERIQARVRSSLSSGGKSTSAAPDASTAAAFSSSWSHLPPGSIYSREQFEDWLRPLEAGDVRGVSVLELGCGNASLLTHLAEWRPSQIVGVDLGVCVFDARRNLKTAAFPSWRVVRADLTTFRSTGFEVVLCIGVIHHLAEPHNGLRAVIRNTTPGGRFHCWVYAREGNLLVRLVVEPLRRLCCRLPWWFTKYFVATPAMVPYFLYAKLLARLPRWAVLGILPLHDYSRWISSRDFDFFRHVAFDQLVTPRTVYFSGRQIAGWLRGHPAIEPGSTYLSMRNGNSWKFGGRRRPTEVDPENVTGAPGPVSRWSTRSRLQPN